MVIKEGIIHWMSEIKLTHEGFRPVLIAATCINGEVMTYKLVAHNEDDIYRFIVNAKSVFVF